MLHKALRYVIIAIISLSTLNGCSTRSCFVGEKETFEQKACKSYDKEYPCVLTIEESSGFYKYYCELE